MNRDRIPTVVGVRSVLEALKAGPVKEVLQPS